LVIGAENAQVCDLIGVVGYPCRAGLLESGLQDMPMSGFDLR
jgi:hypothetical protein